MGEKALFNSFKVIYFDQDKEAKSLSEIGMLEFTQNSFLLLPIQEHTFVVS